MPIETNNIVCFSDTHSGCRLALCPPEGVDLDDGGAVVCGACGLLIDQNEKSTKINRV